MRKTSKLFVIGLAATGMLLSACSEPVDNGEYTYNEYVTTSPSNWNELTYQDNNDTEILDFISGSLFTFNFDFVKGQPVEGGYSINYDGATKLEDVTADYAGDPNYKVPETAESGYAYKITLRSDLKWDDGTPINADDFVYSMSEQLNPLFKNFRADSYYNGSTVICNAERYLKQGMSGVFASKSAFDGKYSEDLDSQLVFDGFYGDGAEGDESSYLMNWFISTNGSNYASYVANYGVFIIPYLYGGTSMTVPECIAAATALDGKTLTEIKADATLKGYYDILDGWWRTEPDEVLDYFITDYTFPAMDFSKVGLFKGSNDLELIIVLNKTLNLLKSDKSLSYKAPYNFRSLPLVKRDLYEANKHAPAIEGGLWTTTYNTSLESTASWGPYKLTYFQAGKQFILEKNEYWYGWNMPEVYGKDQYKTTKIVCDTLKDWNTAWLQFQSGDLAAIGIDVSIAAEYKNSSRAYYTASDFVSSLQLQSSETALRGRSTPEANKLMLLYPDFRAALSLSIDRADYANKVTTASLAGFGLFNSMHYMDVESGLVYRNTDEAKKAICAAYGVNVDDYPSLDEAYQAVTGYNLELARTKLEAAYAEAKAAGDITDTDVVDLVVGAAEDTEGARRQYDYLKAAFETLAVGTSLEGRLTLSFDTSFGDEWANDFRDGAYDICTGGWTGAAWDPCYLIMAYLSPEYMYSQGWDTSAEELTYNPYQDGKEEHEFTMSLYDWYECLNGLSDYDDRDWSEGNVDVSFRLGILAQLEKAVLQAYYTVPITYTFTAGLMSYKCEHFVENYNTFMGYGGIRYLKYNYNDEQWAAVKGSFDYKK